MTGQTPKTDPPDATAANHMSSQLPESGPFRSAFQSRVVGLTEKRADSFLAHPDNWRVHGWAQQEALSGVLGTVGWVTGVVENVRTGHLVDGHLRVQEALKRGDGEMVPVVLVDLSPEEERLVLASLDPIGAMATGDAEKLGALLADIEAEDERVTALLAKVALDAGVLPPEEPLEALMAGVEEGESRFSVTLSCSSREIFVELLDRVGASAGPLDTRVLASGDRALVRWKEACGG